MIPARTLHVFYGLTAGCIVLAAGAIAAPRHHVQSVAGTPIRVMAGWSKSVLFLALRTVAALGALAVFPLIYLAVFPLIYSDLDDGGSFAGNDLAGGVIELLIVVVWACVLPIGPVAAWLASPRSAPE
jgi:hypothetical protein